MTCTKDKGMPEQKRPKAEITRQSKRLRKHKSVSKRTFLSDAHVFVIASLKTVDCCSTDDTPGKVIPIINTADVKKLGPDCRSAPGLEKLERMASGGRVGELEVIVEIDISLASKDFVSQDHVTSCATLF